MGYQTEYQVTVEGDVHSCVDLQTMLAVKSALEALSEYQWAISPERGENVVFVDDMVKWYNHHEDMMVISSDQAFVGLTLVLYGVGEGMNEEWDEWKKHYRGGRMVKLERLRVTTAWEEQSVEAYVQEQRSYNEAIKRVKAEMRRDKQ